MGINDRDYHRNERREGGGLFAQLTPVVKWLLILNLGIYLLDTLLKGEAHDGPIRQFGAFAMESAIFQGRIWEFITFQFLHGSIGHVVFNCMGIFFFGPWLERWWGSKKFLIFYLLCGIGGSLFFCLLMALHVLPETWVPLTVIDPSEVAGLIVRNGMVLVPQHLVGASAGIYGIFIGVAMIAPNLRVMLLLPPIELSMRQLAIALMAISVGSILFKLGGNEGGEAGHLGGAILGFFLMRYPQLLGREPGVEIIRPMAIPRTPAAKLRPRSELEKDQDSAVDVILDKISREGFQSLTHEERDFLQKASNSKKST